MSEHVNLSPGAPAPESGDYKCVFCAMRAAMGGVPTAESIRSNVFGHDGGTIKHFQRGETLTECPQCGDATGWTLLN